MQRVATARAVHALDAAQPLDDHAAVQAAAAAASTPQERVLARAWWLGDALALPQAWQQLRRLGLGVWLALVAVVVLLAWGMSAAVMGEGTRVNLLGALVSLLGMNLVMLLLWLLSVVLPSRSVGGPPVLLGGWVPRAMAWGAARLGTSAQRLLAGTWATLGQARATPWLTGLVSHSAWALGFALILLVMGTGFAFRAYQPVVETTILSPGAQQALINGLGWLPAQLGVATPTVAAWAASPSGAAQAGGAPLGLWAWWLMACVLVYGLLPRVLLAGLCGAVLRRRLARVRLPEDDAGFQWALARFNRLQGSRVIDADASPAPAAPVASAVAGQGWALLVHEQPGLDSQDAALWRAVQAAQRAAGWPSLPAPVWTGDCDGSAESAAACVAAVAGLGRPRLVVAVAGSASPDRSVARLLRSLVPLAAELRLWLSWPPGLAAPEVAQHIQRWADWLQAEGLAVGLLNPGEDA
ncbi:hypothetical protein CCO03_12985 [Comamonas serinivorans]|uniref:DUF2868 domain-containing protein n=1 Tax=Comamonas serinivorans TaxID=1082851 RepID=A0A1Y0EPS0_9BURK|nr:hypothetical protein CCO03_12985 [Comamonas serinivorans]